MSAAELRAIFSHSALGPCACGRVHAVEVDGCEPRASRMCRAAHGRVVVRWSRERVCPRATARRAAWDGWRLRGRTCATALRPFCAPWSLSLVCRGSDLVVRGRR